MSYWYLFGILPVFFMGYLKAVKHNHRTEIEELLVLLQEKESLNEAELQFITEAKEFLYTNHFLSETTNKVLNNQEKND